MAFLGNTQPHAVARHSSVQPVGNESLLVNQDAFTNVGIGQIPKAYPLAWAKSRPADCKIILAHWCRNKFGVTACGDTLMENRCLTVTNIISSQHMCSGKTIYPPMPTHTHQDKCILLICYRGEATAEHWIP